MKFGRYILVAVVFFLGVTIADVNAQTVDFSITANSSWGRDTTFNSSTKNVGNSNSAVKWLTSNKSSHKMWFRVVDESGKQMGKGLLSYLTTGAFTTNLTWDQPYYLQARRENIIDPLTTVTGRWLA